ncbi:MAG: DHHA1 domain-containing protein [Candidatus Scalindua sp.]|nr:DHHA1 domain-containing protein [Candidatus Scalindua sp.]
MLEVADKKWIFSPLSINLQNEIARSLRISPIVSQVLINRGVTDAEEAKVFLRPQLSFLRDPSLLPDIEKSANRIIEAITNGEKITVYGDYDVDGISATALMVECLEVLVQLNGSPKSEIDYYIPDRLEEGYGLNTEAVEMLSRSGTKVIITVDCGSNSFTEAEVAKKNGVDLIVTDHHEPGCAEYSRPHILHKSNGNGKVIGEGQLTKLTEHQFGGGIEGQKQHSEHVFGMVNPKLSTSLYPFRELAGVGVAFMLAWTIGKSFSKSEKVVSEFKEFLMNAMGYVALGTIADVVPLKRENRILAKYGLSSLQYAKQPGINALKEVAGLKGKNIDSSHVGFCLGPRINAAGRIGNAKMGVEMLTARSEKKAQEIALYLDNENKKRRKIQNDILASAKRKILDEMDAESVKVLIITGDNWHPGVIGVVASRLVGEYYKPVIIISTENDIGHGSARSIPGFHLYDALEECEMAFPDKKLFISYGGHSQAAGLRILKRDIPEFKRRFYDIASECLRSEDLIPTLHVDLEIELASISRSILHELSRLSPHGEGNPVPVFAARGVRIVGRIRRFGIEGKHVNFYVRQENTTFRAVAFGLGERCEIFQKGDMDCSIAFTLREAYQAKEKDFQEFGSHNGSFREKLELEVMDISP